MDDGAGESAGMAETCAGRGDGSCGGSPGSGGCRCGETDWWRKLAWGAFTFVRVFFCLAAMYGSLYSVMLNPN